MSLGVTAYASFAGVTLHTGLPISESPLIYGWGFGLVTLLTTAFIARRDPKGRFENVVASEVIVVYGITTLVLSIGLGVTRTANVWQSTSGPPPLDQLVPAMRVFSEGFIAAGVSPFCAVAIRQLDVLSTVENEPVGRVSGELDDLKRSIANAAGATNAFATSIKQAADSLQRASAEMTVSFEALGAGGVKAKSGLDAASDAASAVTNQFKPAANELARLGSAAAEGSVLLDGLKDIIASVEQFIPAGRNGNGSAS
jgi:hypothetical protein